MTQFIEHKKSLAIFVTAALLVAGAALAWSGPGSNTPPTGSPTFPGVVLSRICTMTPTSNNCGPTGSYVVPSNVVYETVEVWGGGGGGMGGGNGSAGSGGGTTCFGTNSGNACTSPLVSASGGQGGPGAGEGGNGGTGASGDVNLTGSAGSTLTAAISTALYAPGGTGGSAPHGGGGQGNGYYGSPGANGAPFGGGGQGGGMSGASNSYFSGSGGGGGGYALKLISSPLGTYYYSVGGGGAGGANGGTCGGYCNASSNGGNGGAGGIIIYEYSSSASAGIGVGTGVSQIIAGSGITVNPSGGTGNVTLATGIPTIAHAQGDGPNDGTDVGQIASRVLTFTKLQANTQIRIGYVDNLRTYSDGANAYSCRWEIKVDGQSCSTPLIYDVYSGTQNLHQARGVFGYCQGISAGTHTIQVWVGNTPGYSNSDCYTGWNGQTWALEAQEVN